MALPNINTANKSLDVVFNGIPALGGAIKSTIVMKNLDSVFRGVPVNTNPYTAEAPPATENYYGAIMLMRFK